MIEEVESIALLYNATGTGKTYASAFAVRDMKPSKFLFIVHREQVAKQAMKSYKNVFDNIKKFGLLSGNSKDYKSEYLFSTMQMMGKQETLERFRMDEFDIIIIDEVHRAGSDSYQRIMEYFKPKFWLGMTASPERTDEFDIYGLFDHKIALEIRLQQALEEDLLCPFHYFGITELEIDGEVIGDKSMKNFSNLVCDARVDYILQKAIYFGYSGDRVKGLIFCSRQTEARALSEQFNKRSKPSGETYNTLFLGGDASQEYREDCIDRLTCENREDKLDYIFTVDIFNEGVDVPEINQVIMLRPTESPIVFIQQLGRGLRKKKEKEYVVILDFIGNYINNFMIPIALSGDRSYNKDTIRKYVSSGSRIIPGSSTIHFDEISKERIFRSIDQIKGIKKLIRERYQKLKYKLGRIPNLVDFYVNGEIDPILILDNYKTYYQFLMEVERDSIKFHMSNQDILILEYLSKIIARGKRPHELIILKEILEAGVASKDKIQEELVKRYKIDAQDQEIEAAVRVLNGTFVSNEKEAKKYKEICIMENKTIGFYKRISSFYERLMHKEFSNQIGDILELGIRRYEDIYDCGNKCRGKFILYEKYSRRDVCHLLNWGKDLSSTMYGMKRIDDNVVLFVTYYKGESEDDKEYLHGKPDYADEFINNQIFMWDSQIGKGPDSSYMRDVCEAGQKHLFVKKSDAEGTDFYYMGKFDIMDIKAEKKKDNKGKLKDISKVKLRMKEMVREDLYEYLKKG